MRRKLLYFLGFAALITATVLLFQRDFDSALFLESFSNVRPVWLLASVVATFITYAIRALRWQVLLISLKLIRLGSLVMATLLGFGAMYALGRAGELVRPVWIARTEEISTIGSFAAIVLERVFDLLLLLLVFSISLAFVQLPIGAEGSVSMLAQAAWVILAVAASSLGISILFEKYVTVIAKKFAGRRIRRYLETFREGLAATSNLRNLGFVAGYSLLLWLVIAIQFWLMMMGLNFDLPISATTLVLVGSALGSIAQVPGIGGGFQAAFIFCLTTFFLVPVETAIAASLIAWVITYTPTLLVAAIYMMWKGISTHDLVVQEPV
jgi:uncharacterized protein (TIRG00374 family)